MIEGKIEGNGSLLMPIERANVLLDITDERRRQIKKWGVQSWPDGTGASYYRIQARAYQALNQSAKPAETNWLDILLEEVYEAAAEGDVDKLDTELNQAAAVIVAWREDIARRRG